MSKSVSKRIQTNLLQQNCFVRDVAMASDLGTTYPEKKYVSVDEKVTGEGIKVERTENVYPITPQYVNSFVDSSDYRRDPANAIANGVSRQNLGDVTSFQSVMSMDSSKQRELYEQLKNKFSKPVENPKSVENPESVESEVK